MSTDSVSSPKNAFVRWDNIPSLSKRIIEIIRTWRRRSRSRSELAGLTVLELKDIGYPAEAEVEKYRPFWRV